MDVYKDTADSYLGQRDADYSARVTGRWWRLRSWSEACEMVPRYRVALAISALIGLQYAE
jgi:hypothetical protein